MITVTLRAHATAHPLLSRNGYKAQGTGYHDLEVCVKTKQSKALLIGLDAFFLPRLGRLAPWLWVVEPMSFISLTPFCDVRPRCLSGTW